MAVRIRAPVLARDKIPKTHRSCPGRRPAEDLARNDIEPQLLWRAVVYPSCLGGFETAAPCSPNFRQNVRDFHRRPRGFGAAVDFIFKATRACLTFVIKSEHYVDYWHTVLDCDALQSIGNGATQVLCMIGFALQNHTTGDDRVGLVLNGKLACDNGNLERTRDAMNQDRTVWRERAELLHHVIYEAVYVLRVKPARNDMERSFGLGD